MPVKLVTNYNMTHKNIIFWLINKIDGQVLLNGL